MVLFEWDEAKAESNLRKHGIDFKDAIEVFYDPEALMDQDRHVDGEARWQTIGRVGGVVVICVAHTVEDRREGEVIRVISARLADRRSGDDMGERVRKAWGEGRIGEERVAELRQLADSADTAIDYSDIPPVSEEFWQRAIPNPFYKPVKKQVTVRIDADVLAWLRQGKDGYQTRLNAAPREAMLLEMREKQRRA